MPETLLDTRRIRESRLREVAERPELFDLFICELNDSSLAYG
jgi:hypothetical protein